MCIRDRLKSGRKLKIKNITLDERDMLLDSVEYIYKDDGSFSGVKMMNSTMTKWIRTCIDGDISDKALIKYTFEEKTELFTILQGMFTMGEEEASK